MKLAIISDIHSNLHALEAVTAEIGRLRVDQIICAGDLVGYGAFPNECCEIVKRLTSRTVLGNHDRACLKRDSSGMNPYAAKAILWTANVLNDDSRRFIGGLPEALGFTIEDTKIAMFHGSPKSVEDYVFEEDVNQELIETGGGDVLILGHTHIPFIKRLLKGLFVNPGAVGQPRDRQWRASFAFLDSLTGECTIRRVEYDLDAAARAIRSAGLPGMLAERLFYGA